VRLSCAFCISHLPHLFISHLFSHQFNRRCWSDACFIVRTRCTARRTHTFLAPNSLPPSPLILSPCTSHPFPPPQSLHTRLRYDCQVGVQHEPFKTQNLNRNCRNFRIHSLGRKLHPQGCHVHRRANSVRRRPSANAFL
jgi:hypothetical protein